MKTPIATLAAFVLAGPVFANESEERRDWPTEAKFRLQSVAECIVDNSEGKVSRLLQSDFRSNSYKKGLERVATDNRGCWREHRLRASYGLPFAGALAEVLIERNNDSVVARVFRASSTEPVTYSATDALASCVARRRPGITASLFGTEIGSEAESQAIVALSDTIAQCAAEAGFDGQLRNIRYLLATATYRLVANHENQGANDA